LGEKPKLGEILVRAGVVDPDRLRAALGEQQRWGGRLGQTLIAMEVLSERDLVRALASQLGVPVVHLAGKRIEQEILDLVPVEFAEKHGCLPLFVKEVDGARSLFMGMEDPSDVEALDDARFRVGMTVSPIMVSPSDLRDAIARCYPEASPVQPVDIERAPAEVVLEELAKEPEASVSIENEASAVAAEVVLHDALRTVGSTELLKALTQLLVEKRILGAEELTERILLLRKSEESS